MSHIILLFFIPCFSLLSTMFFLARDVYGAEPMVITASMVPVSLSTIGSSITIIDQARLKKQQTMFVSDILRNVTGLSVTKNGGVGTLTEVRARGAESNHTLVLIDGVAGNTEVVFGSAFPFSSLMAKDIERIEVLRGPQSALWGSDAIGAVINIITKRKQDGFHIVGNSEFGSFGMENIAVSFFTGDKTKYLNFNAESYHSDGINIAREGTEDDSYDNKTYSLKAGFIPIKGLHVDTMLRHMNDDLDTDPQAGRFVTDSEGHKMNSRQTYINTKASLFTFKDIWYHEFNFELVKAFSDSFLQDFSFSTNSERVKLSYLSNINYDTSNNIAHGLSVLFEYEDKMANGNFIGGNNNVGFITKAVAIEYRLGVLNDFYLSVSTRHDNQHLFKDATTYRVSGTYNFTKVGTRIHSSYGTAIKNPTINELYGNFPTFTGNLNLKPERSVGWDIGIEQFLFDDILLFDLTFFNNTITDLIQGQNTTAINLTGQQKIQGIEFFLNTSLTETLSLNTHYTYTNSNGADGLELVRRPKHIGGFNIDWLFWENKANINLNVNYHGKRQDFDFGTFPAGRVALTDYTLVNLAARYKVNNNITLLGRIENLLNTDYEEVFGYQTPGIAVFAGINLALNP